MSHYIVSLPVVGRIEAVIEAENADEARAAAWALFEADGEDGFEEVEVKAQAMLGATVTIADVGVELTEIDEGDDD
jgi:hypothetical protein